MASTIDRIETTTPSVERNITTIAPPTPESQQYLERQLTPLRKQYGILPDGSSDPFVVLGYKPEVRQADLERKRELEAWKQKEAGIYNGIALAVDAMTAGLGGNVQRRDVGNLAADAAIRQQQLDILNQQQSAAEQEKLRANSATYAGLVNKLTEDYLQKVQTTQKSGGQKIVHQESSPEVVYRTHYVGGGGGGSSSSSRSGGGGSGRSGGSRWLFTVTARGGSGRHYQIELTEQQYRNVQGVLFARYKSLLNDESRSQAFRDDLKRRLVSAGILRKATDWADDSKWNKDQIMRNGLFFELTDADRQLLNQFTQGKVRFTGGGSGAGHSGGTWDYNPSESENQEQDEYEI